LLAATLLLGSVLGFAGWIVWQNWRSGNWQTSTTVDDPTAQVTTRTLDASQLPADSPDRFSSGERRLLRYQSNRDGDRAAVAFAAGDYAQAKQLFENAIQGDRRDPEVQLYRNNAIARLSKEPAYKLAVVVPVDAAASSAEEILRGIADAQAGFNEANGSNGRLLEIIIANDGNDPKISPGVARKIGQDPTILGVIGHNASAATEAAVPEYEKAGIPVMTATSGGTTIASRVFFRAVLSNQITGTLLAEHAKNTLKLERIAIFFNPNDVYSRSVQEAFVDRFEALGGRFVKAIDMSSPDFQIDKQVKQLAGKFDAIAMFPNTDLVTVGLSIASANNQLPGNQKMQVMGGTTLYTPRTLSSGGNAVEGLILSIPWFAQTPYAYEASVRWGGQVSWRTAMGYDATLAFLNTLSGTPTRSNILQNLRAVRLPADRTSGDSLQFSPSGERLGQPILVQVVKGGGGPVGSGLVFKALN
jgi:branched-chain amino acid transport system substrate-binding protein